MHLIKNCPACGKKIRFPLDKGKIRVKCSCGFDFIADPDDPSLFRESSFDLGRNAESEKPGLIDRVLNSLESIDPAGLKNRAIRGLYDFKYSIQNFRLLPTGEKIKLLAIIAAIIAAGLLIILALNSHHTPAPIDDTVI
ncbi:MAG TPA: hypothetical protein PK573_01095 [Spirochaetota bacterium]|nr:hypothetical protein [Spirochaetota bacterium]HRZ25966.1 hypothetical protein [Spirochaetota bacterium]